MPVVDKTECFSWIRLFGYSCHLTVKKPTWVKHVMKLVYVMTCSSDI